MEWRYEKTEAIGIIMQQEIEYRLLLAGTNN